MKFYNISRRIWKVTGLTINPVSTDNRKHKWRNSNVLQSCNFYSFFCVKLHNSQTTRLLFSSKSRSSLSFHSVRHFEMVFTHLGDPQACQVVWLPAAQQRFHIVILGLIRSHNGAGVKSQYCEHCPCHPSIHLSATTQQELLAQLGQKVIAPYGDGCVFFGAVCVCVCAFSGGLVLVLG